MGNTVLVVEDYPTLLSMLAYALRASGHTPLLKSDATTALEELPDEAPDVILCDVHLPGVIGAEFTLLLKSAPLPALRNTGAGLTLSPPRRATRLRYTTNRGYEQR